ncbi:MAG: hypothetical protein ACT6FG_00390 [Methanosarcinaceae archaeon]
MNSSEFIDFVLDNSPEIIGNASDTKYFEDRFIIQKMWKTKSKTRAWINVVGYTGMIKYNNTFYINEPHTEAAYIMYGTEPKLYGKYKLDSLNSHISDISYDGVLSTTLDTKLKYHYFKIKKNQTTGKIISKKRINKTELNKFTYVDQAPPERFPKHIKLKNLTVIVYNNSLIPRSSVRLVDVDYVLGYRVKLFDDWVKYYFNVLEVEYMAKYGRYNFPYGNFTEYNSNSIYEKSDMFSRANNVILINSTDIENNLKIYAITPYEEIEVNYTVSNYSSGKKHTSVELSSIFGILLMGWFIVFLIKRMYRG